MRRIFCFMMVTALFCSCTKEENETQGSIYGVITEMDSAEPMRATSVELHSKSNNSNYLLLTKTVTYDDGHYEFNNLSTGSYRLVLNAEGYKNITHDVLVDGSKTSKGDMQLERLVIGVSISANISQISTNFATIQASYTVSSYSPPQISEVGFFYAKHKNPSNGGSKMVATKYSIGGGLNFTAYGFNSTATGLIPNSTYYVQAFIKSSINNGIAIDYSNEISFIAADYITIGSIDIQQTDISNQSNWITAKMLCEQSAVGGHFDWRLPTVGELGLIYANKGIIGGLSGYYYWSSTPYNTNYYYQMVFNSTYSNSSGATTYHNQNYSSVSTATYPSTTYTFHVRAVRTHN